MYSSMLPLTGWIFDVYPTSGGMVVWVVDAEGNVQPVPATAS